MIQTRRLARTEIAYLTLLLGCASSTPAPRVVHRAPVHAAATTEAPEPEPLANVKVRGLTGTLNKDDVHQTMDARQPEFDLCVNEVRRQHRYVSGTLRFAFKVDGTGRVEEARMMRSDVGHRALEQCIATVVAETEFPRPAGRARAQFEWDMHVDGIFREPPEELDPKSLRNLLRKKARNVFRDCKVRRYRNRLTVTAYVGRRGRVLSLGAVPKRPIEDEKLDCMLEVVKGWQMPKQKRRSKVSFVLR